MTTSDGTQTQQPDHIIEQCRQWRTFVPDMLRRLKESKRGAVKKGANGKELDFYNDIIGKLERAYEIARIHDGHGPRSGYWIQEACKRAQGVQRVLDAEHGTVSA